MRCNQPGRFMEGLRLLKAAARIVQHEYQTAGQSMLVRHQIFLVQN